MKVIIFDLDGVLADTHKLLKIVNKPFYEKHGIPVEEVRKELHGLPFSEKIKRINEKYGKDIDPEQAAAETAHKLVDISVQSQPMQGAVDLVKELYRRGFLLALATSGTREYCERVLKNIGLDKYFVYVLTADDVERPKPDPEIYKLIAQHFGVRPTECAVIDDSPHCLRAALGVGMKTFGVLCELTTCEELAQIAVRVVVNLSELKPDDFS